MSSKIEWTEETWNPTVGCSEASTGCKNCYAKSMTHRLGHNPKMGDRYTGLTTKKKNGKVDFTGELRLNEAALLKPLKKKKPTMYFVNSMSDLFHENVPFEWIDKVFAVMTLCPQHTFQILTKRAERMKEYFDSLHNNNEHKFRLSQIKIGRWNSWSKLLNFAKYSRPLPNVWLGVSVENQTQAIKRIPYLLKTPAAVRFVSAEPLLGKIDFTSIFQKEVNGVKCYLDALKGFDWWYDAYEMEGDYKWHGAKLDWIIVGGESGHGARPMHPDWVRSIRDQCKESGVPFFFKQWGDYKPLIQKNSVVIMPSDIIMNEYGHINCKIDIGRYVGFSKVGKKEAGNLLDGEQYLQMPI